MQQNQILKNATGVDTSKFAKKVDLASLKSNVDQLDIDKLKKLKNIPTNLNNLKSKVGKLDLDKLVPAPFDLSKLGDKVKNEVVKKTEYVRLRSKILKIKYLILLT